MRIPMLRITKIDIPSKLSSQEGIEEGIRDAETHTPLGSVNWNYMSDAMRYQFESLGTTQWTGTDVSILQGVSGRLERSWVDEAIATNPNTAHISNAFFARIFDDYADVRGGS
jgi:hypothetical protein